MARSGSNENKDANQQMAANQKKSFGVAQDSIAAGKAAFAKLASGQNIGADPFKNAGYLGNVNKLQSSALDTADDAAKQTMESENRRTGGLNTSGTMATEKDLALGKMRLGDQLTAERSANDYRSNIGYQQQLLQDTYQPAELEAPYYGTATTGRDSALGNLTQLGIASYGPWMSAIQAAGGAASTGLSQLFKPATQPADPGGR